MLTAICWLAFMWAMISDRNKCTELTILCWLAFVVSACSPS